MVYRANFPNQTILGLGLMSGTSMDGLDIALVEIKPGERSTFALSAYETTPYPPQVRQAIASAVSDESCSIQDLSRLNFRLGHFFGDCVMAFLQRQEINPNTIDFIGSHGQTICHLPDSASGKPGGESATLQIGDPAVLAVRTGILTVGDFRVADMACGGQGAPLAPFLDYHFLHEVQKNQIFLNIGGLANICALTAHCGANDVVAFDTGPGNMLLDHISKESFSQPYDRDGRNARQGRYNPELLDRYLSHNFFSRTPPKSADRQALLRDLNETTAAFVAGADLSGADLLATAVELTAVSVLRAWEKFLAKTAEWDELIISGGGAKNVYLMTRLDHLFPGVSVMASDDLGVPGDAKEAICFALMGYYTLIGRANNLPAATGARQPAVLGKICPVNPSR